MFHDSFSFQFPSSVTTSVQSVHNYLGSSSFAFNGNTRNCGLICCWLFVSAAMPHRQNGRMTVFPKKLPPDPFEDDSSAVWAMVGMGLLAFPAKCPQGHSSEEVETCLPH